MNRNPFPHPILTVLILCALSFWLISCSDGLTRLERIQERGQLRVAIMASPPMFFPDESMLRGLDYQIAQQYGKYINVELDIIVAKTLGEMLTLLKQGKAHVAIADSSPEINDEGIHTSIPYNPNQWHVVGNRNHPLPHNIQAISPGRLYVAAGSGPARVMKVLGEKHYSLYWSEMPESNSRDILEKINQELLQLTVINEDVFTYYRHLYPELKIALKLDEYHSSVWLTSDAGDDSLRKSVDQFLDTFIKTKELKRLKEIYFSHLRSFNYVDNDVFLKRIKTHLPKYSQWFTEAADQFHFDKRFLAAVSYQESHWKKDAVSMTGVKGLMMLTKETAKRVGVNNRLDPKQSITGGAKYLNILRDSLPKDIREPDRSWMTLAAYNIGLGHLEDARILTELAGDNPDLWIDVEKHLPKLSEEEWHTQTKHGYARGSEPVAFVRRIHRYFDILRLYEQELLLKQFYRPLENKDVQFNSPLF